jgi:hypothetical protein
MPDEVWFLLEEPLPENLDDPDVKQHGNRGRGWHQCLCGKYAKYTGHHYTYQGECVVDLVCKTCGPVQVY